MNIHLLVTGGTIDKEYHELTGELAFKDTHLPEMLSLGRSTLQVEIQTVMMIDSLLMTAADRERIAECCRTVSSDRIVVTHGTDTMTETAKALAHIAGKTIVLTGALSPARFAETDAPFNLGMAFAAAQVALPGVYIAMSGQVFDGLKVRKDRAAGRFVAL